MKEVENIVEWHEDIAKAVRETERSVLLVISPIPDRKGYTREIFETLHQKLEVAIADADYVNGKTHHRLFYVNFVDKHLPYRHTWRLYKDPVHLNRFGTKLLAKEIFCRLIQVPNQSFGFEHILPSTKQKKEFWSKLQMTRAEFRDEVDVFLRTIREAAPGSAPYLQPLPFRSGAVVKEVEKEQDESIDLRQVLEERRTTKDPSTTFHAVDWEMEDLTAVDANGNPI